jgi:hypothetical protein
VCDDPAGNATSVVYLMMLEGCASLLCVTVSSCDHYPAVRRRPSHVHSPGADLPSSGQLGSDPAAWPPATLLVAAIMIGILVPESPADATLLIRAATRALEGDRSAAQHYGSRDTTLPTTEAASAIAVSMIALAATADAPFRCTLGSDALAGRVRLFFGRVRVDIHSGKKRRQVQLANAPAVLPAAVAAAAAGSSAFHAVLDHLRDHAATASVRERADTLAVLLPRAAGGSDEDKVRGAARPGFSRLVRAGLATARALLQPYARGSVFAGFILDCSVKRRPTLVCPQWEGMPPSSPGVLVTADGRVTLTGDIGLLHAFSERLLAMNSATGVVVTVRVDGYALPARGVAVRKLVRDAAAATLALDGDVDDPAELSALRTISGGGDDVAATIINENHVFHTLRQLLRYTPCEGVPASRYPSLTAKLYNQPGFQLLGYDGVRLGDILAVLQPPHAQQTGQPSTPPTGVLELPRSSHGERDALFRSRGCLALVDPEAAPGASKACGNCALFAHDSLRVLEAQREVERTPGASDGTIAAVGSG